ncbi:Methionine synthase, vitamin-B12 independent [Propionibacterium freudenreichii]|uniref:hypothetical protein n=1 Tax=Propionibacterium freudenreichii TaxID=1744 RepID=UPI000543A04D|nr:hypothetical protein [Propionibacterium freudenreichii]CEH03528.1 Methionine synthase, vitamin-B12 independent [Propionibacterium freudenreichii]
MIATALGSFAGTDLRATARAVLGELPDRAPIVELPDRGPQASMIARTAAMLPDMPFDRRPSGWRLAPGPSLVGRRAAALFNDDVTMTAEVIEDWQGTLTLTMAGPWTLLASLDLVRGGRAVGDAGARRDLAQAWLAGAVDRIAHTRSQLDRPLAVQIDEPALPAVLAGTIPDESGRRRLPAVEAQEVQESLGACVDATRGAAEDIVVIHCCADRPPLTELAAAAPDALSIDTQRLDGASWDALAQWFSAEPGPGMDHALWLGLLPTSTPGFGVDAIRVALDECRRRLDADPDGPGDRRLALTPARGLASADPVDAFRALADLAAVARG